MYHVEYLEASRTSMMGVFEKIGNGFKQLTIFSKKKLYRTGSTGL